jgi:hypothetical protein
VVAHKIRSGTEHDITLGELAGMTDTELPGKIRSALVRGTIRSLLAPKKGMFYGDPAYHGMIDAFLDGPPRVATPKIVRRMLDLSSREQIFLDVWAPMWNFFNARGIRVSDGVPVLSMAEPRGWLAEQVAATIGGEQHPVVIVVEDAGGREPIGDVAGYWVCFMEVELE